MSNNNPYDDVPVVEALDQLYDRFNDRTVRQALFTVQKGAAETTALTTCTSANILKPLDDYNFNGLSITYADGVFSITGTKTSGMRAVLGEITPTVTGSYTISYVDRNGNKKPSIYITLGEEIIATYKQSDATVVATLEAGKTYTVEFYVTKGVATDYAISLQCELGGKTAFKKYGTIIKKDHDLSSYNMSILGVSIDTYEGWVVPGNNVYYKESNLPSVDMTWWKKLMDETGIKLLVNNSWNGACASTVKGVPQSAVHRCTNLDNGSLLPDIILIGMYGANDWAYSAVGEYTFSTSLPSADVDLTDSTQYETYKSVVDTYKGAMATVFKRIHEKYPHARVYALDMYNYYRGENLDPAGKSDTQNIPTFNKALYDVAEWFGVTVIKCSECGINAINSVDYCVDASTGVALHPNDNGHTLIYRKVLAALLQDFNS